MIHHSHSKQTPKALAKVTHWRCLQCGQIRFTTSVDDLPARCDICQQATQWEELGDHLRRWRCPNCGQLIFTAPDDLPPDMCDYCNDFTTWRRIYD